METFVRNLEDSYKKAIGWKNGTGNGIMRSYEEEGLSQEECNNRIINKFARSWKDALTTSQSVAKDDDEGDGPSAYRTTNFSSAALHKKQKTNLDTMLHEGLQRSKSLYKERTEMEKASRENEYQLKLAQDNKRLEVEKERWEREYQLKVNQAQAQLEHQQRDLKIREAHVQTDYVKMLLSLGKTPEQAAKAVQDFFK
ncbi:hypothetical protein A0J61_10885 [Choanephora cucurbitarum]|uniref:Uncharacterized protein n=1 Tax=Choanephora cucurbitarum TaxID=101091 RepID=A0A1C7MX96_9FUNG|nr:hypothetical protein A0J61_10885 [Choanephora cucurbitarum]